MRKILSFFLIAGIVFFFSCKKNNYPNEPLIEFKSQSKNTMIQNGRDSMVLTFAYTDGDGDIGNDSIENIFLIDKRTEQILAAYRFPNDTDSKPGEYRKGELQLIVYSGCCIYNNSSISPCGPNPNQGLDTMRYLLEVKDKSGKVSNRIESEDIILECN
jgi:hypothetical protein